MKGFLESLTIREMQIKAARRNHFTAVRMAITNKSTNIKCGKIIEKKGTLIHC